LRQGRNHAANQVKHQIAPRPERRFDTFAEDPKVKHVAADMQPAAVEEHASEDRRPSGHDLQLARQLRLPQQHGRNHAIAENRIARGPGTKARLPQENRAQAAISPMVTTGTRIRGLSS